MQSAVVVLAAVGSELDDVAGDGEGLGVGPVAEVVDAEADAVFAEEVVGLGVVPAFVPGFEGVGRLAGGGT